MKYVERFWFVGVLIFIITVLFQPRLDASIPVENLQAPMSVRYTLDGMASWYSEKSPGIRKRTANNEIFDDRAMTAAMWGVAFNQQIKVTNKANGKSVVVRINDRGPHKRFVRQGRIIDLTKAAFEKIAQPKKGLINIQIEFL